MGAAEPAKSQSSPDYGHGPPWLFKGRALYQLHLVKAETARRFVPEELKLVEAFGYTLGGMFLAHYDASPAGVFDELVVIAGIVWDPPTSCAWAARVLVNSHEACKHGRKEIGLPSHLAEFLKKKREISSTPRKKHSSILNMIRPGSAFCIPEIQTEIHVIEPMKNAAGALCNITLPFTVPESKQEKKLMGPKFRLSFPSFSGKTMDNPHLLKYSCHMECRVSTVEPAKVSRPCGDKFNQSSKNQNPDEVSIVHAEDEDRDLSISVLLSRPILAVQFDFLEMRVEAPTIFSRWLRTTKTEVPRESFPSST